MGIVPSHPLRGEVGKVSLSREMYEMWEIILVRKGKTAGILSASRRQALYLDPKISRACLEVCLCDSCLFAKKNKSPWVAPWKPSMKVGHSFLIIRADSGFPCCAHPTKHNGASWSQRQSRIWKTKKFFCLLCLISKEVSLHSALFLLLSGCEQFFTYQMFFETVCCNCLVFQGEHSSSGTKSAKGWMLEKCTVGFPLVLIWRSRRMTYRRWCIWGIGGEESEQLSTREANY